MLDFLNYRRPIPKKAVLITIDDGYRSVYTHAYPILKKYGFPVTLFIYTDFAGVGRLACTWDQLREMKAGGIEIGSHSLSHADLTKKRKGETTNAYLERVRKELILSKKIIDEKIHQDTRIFAFPYGRYNKTVMNMARKAGYDLAVSVKRGGNPFFSEPLALKRDQILKRDIKTFTSRLNTFYKLSLR
ncbi:MAG: polysaccharide deacetylase family protein [Deltaproteobacteria bacterium]|nr:polysaccharide deacetylase family protein [Deltaproteobacteria bacterium]